MLSRQSLIELVVGIISCTIVISVSPRSSTTFVKANTRLTMTSIVVFAPRPWITIRHTRTRCLTRSWYVYALLKLLLHESNKTTQDHVETLIADNAFINALPINNFLTWVQSQFNSANYFKCFYYMKGYLDFNKTSALGLWYMKSK